MNIVERKENYNQVCVWEGCVVGPDQIEEFERVVGEPGAMFPKGVRVQYLEEVLTLPSQDMYNRDIPETGGRNDLIFAVHDQDIGEFAVQRLPYGIRWIEDVLSETNNSAYLYDSRLQEYCDW